MNLILFIHQDSAENGVYLKKIIDQNFTRTNIQIHKTFNSFKARLKQFSTFNDKEIFILLADSKNRLKELTSLIDLLEDKRLILILPDNSKGIIARAHPFFPRFFTEMNNTYDDLCGVISKMINQENLNTKNNLGGN